MRQAFLPLEQEKKTRPFNLLSVSEVVKSAKTLAYMGNFHIGHQNQPRTMHACHARGGGMQGKGQANTAPSRSPRPRSQHKPERDDEKTDGPLQQPITDFNERTPSDFGRAGGSIEGVEGGAGR